MIIILLEIKGIWDRDYYMFIISFFIFDVSYDNIDDYYFFRNGVIFSFYVIMFGLLSFGMFNLWNGLGGNVCNIKVYGKFVVYYYL